MRKFIVIAACLSGLAQAQPVAQQGNTPASAGLAGAADRKQAVPAGGNEMGRDTIDARVQRARMLEEARAAEEAAKLRASQPLPLPPGNARFQPNQPGFAPRPEYELLAIRGTDDHLEAALTINGRRVVGSLKYPSLGDGWILVGISSQGVTLLKGKDRMAVSFVANEPYFTAPSATQVVQPVPGAMPAGNPGPMPAMAR